MARKDIGELLESAKLKHLSETMLVSYQENKLDKIQRAIAESHLQDCVICPRRLAFLKSEAEAVANYELTDEDHAANEKFVSGLRPKKKARDYVASLLKDAEEAWILSFSRLATRGAGDGDEVWRYKSKRGALTVRGVLEKNASLTVHFSSPRLAWEGTRIRFQLGTFSKEITLILEGDGVAAKIRIPRAKRPKKMKKFSIEVLPRTSGTTKK